ncbi:A/G-specific adenine glycosylase [Neobacillus notoginsengisoli]|uniref:Adenine DNA glycosylase n=1 Tax=Neobacillus notoginsengisoli TaxID=1578198 RepID=A0A417YJK9_9BACI|nr:A/G-specific adenine glycosylase [Neobacillus notoginsengisoli]RHW33344.1 A/G-specific adenine glycosylase [Neobacillus notoginsengisoli]
MNQPEITGNINIEQFREDLIAWFRAEQRDLPWRADQDPYKIWVSEIMLQQTRVDTVIPYYHRFLELFPTIDALAEADEDKVLKAWEGLGYYSRARNLQSAVREVRDKYNGVVPDSPKEISKLKGVGPYTAGAILSIAYGIPEPAVDGNVMRVLSRILLIREDIAKPASRKIFEEAVRRLISHESPSDFNQALMELGALICTPTSPSCLLCPVREHCIAFHEGVQAQLPVKSKKKKPKQVLLAAAIVEDQDGRILIRRRPAEGLLANFWEFPSIEIQRPYANDREALERFYREELGVKVAIDESLGQIQHIFSHLDWNVTVYVAQLAKPLEDKENLRLVSLPELAGFALPVPHQKMLSLYSVKI